MLLIIGTWKIYVSKNKNEKINKQNPSFIYEVFNPSRAFIKDLEKRDLYPINKKISFQGMSQLFFFHFLVSIL
jgi:hypothetical protein